MGLVSGDVTIYRLVSLEQMNEHKVQSISTPEHVLWQWLQKFDRWILYLIADSKQFGTTEFVYNNYYYLKLRSLS